MFKSEKSRKIILTAAIIAVACLAAAFVVFNTVSKQNRVCRLKLDIVTTALKQYNLDKKQFPESLAVLKDLKYLNAGDLSDAWGSEFIYVPVYKEEGKKKIVTTYMLSSAGRDRKEWTKDDVQ